MGDDSYAIYLAAAYSRRAEMFEYAKILENEGHWITSAWVLKGHDIPDGATPEWIAEHRAKWAEEDLENIRNSDWLLFFSGDGKRNSGGRHVELGYALAVEVDVVVIGERENLFHYLPGVNVFENWEAFLKWLRRGK